MRTKYAIDDFQQTYFVIESFEKLLAGCYQDFALLYERLAAATAARSGISHSWPMPMFHTQVPRCAASTMGARGSASPCGGTTSRTAKSSLSKARRLWAENAEHEVFSFDDSGIDGIQVEEVLP
jgi:hypothetical protein